MAQAPCGGLHNHILCLCHVLLQNLPMKKTLQILKSGRVTKEVKLHMRLFRGIVCKQNRFLEKN